MAPGAFRKVRNSFPFEIMVRLFTAGYAGMTVKEGAGQWDSDSSSDIMRGEKETSEVCVHCEPPISTFVDFCRNLRSIVEHCIILDGTFPTVRCFQMVADVFGASKCEEVRPLSNIVQNQRWNSPYVGSVTSFST